MVNINLITSNLKNIYNQYAEDYNLEHPDISEELKETIDQFINYLPSGANILDLGCGTGRDAKYYLSRGLKVTGTDLSEKMIEVAKREVPTGNFMVDNMLNDDLGIGVYDGISANASLLHIPKMNLKKVLTKIHKALKENGIFWLGLKAGKGEHEVESDINGIKVKRFYAFYSKTEIEKILTQSHFNILKIVSLKSRSGKWWLRIICRKK